MLVRVCPGVSPRMTAQNVLIPRRLCVCARAVSGVEQAVHYGIDGAVDRSFSLLLRGPGQVGGPCPVAELVFLAPPLPVRLPQLPVGFCLRSDSFMGRASKLVGETLPAQLT
jgi:hypothetical protein